MKARCGNRRSLEIAYLKDAMLPALAQASEKIRLMLPALIEATMSPRLLRSGTAIARKCEHHLLVDDRVPLLAHLGRNSRSWTAPITDFSTFP